MFNLREIEKKDLDSILSTVTFFISLKLCRLIGNLSTYTISYISMQIEQMYQYSKVCNTK